MSSDERILRLENAMATLAELSAGQEQRIARLEESFRELAQVTTNQQRRVTRLEESFVMLVEMTNRLVEGANELRMAQAESERKIAALADAQAHTDQRLDILIDIVRNERDGQSPSN